MTTEAQPIVPGQPAELISSDRMAWGVLAVAFILCRLGYWLAGVRFDAAPVSYLPQVLDPDLLRHDLFRSIWYLHSQPPLFNLMIGSVLRVAPGSSGGVFALIYLVASLVLVFGLYDLGRQLELGRVLSVVIAIVVGCGPTVVIFSSNVNYDALVMVLVVLLLDACARWVRSGHVRTLVAIGALAAAATLTRSLFHPAWFVSIVVLALVMRRPQWGWKPVAAIAIPALLVGGALVKNEVLFGTPQLSTWFGYNLYRSTVQSLAPEEQAQLKRDGVISAPLSGTACRVDHPDVPAVALRTKLGPCADHLNLNWECGIASYQALATDAIAAIRARTRRGWPGACSARSSCGPCRRLSTSTSGPRWSRSQDSTRSTGARSCSTCRGPRRPRSTTRTSSRCR